MCIDSLLYTHWGSLMRTNIEIDDELLAQAMKAAGLKTKKATVEEALRMLVRQHRQKKAIADMAGLGWDGDLDEMREGRGMKSLR
jgi:Arc/MetJ family transcription regulator